MPLWQVFHPVDAYTAEDKKALANRITDAYAKIPLPRFYVVTVFHAMPADSLYVGGEPRSNFVRFKVDQMARTMIGQIHRAWWMRRVEDIIAPFVKERGFDSEVQIDEPPADLWTINGYFPPPFESIAEKRWVSENRTSPYTEDEKVPSGPRTSRGATDGA
jgi:phenylpyruvate tautomerase PptA (4-oxalocrotonate tautomerase family)